MKLINKILIILSSCSTMISRSSTIWTSKGLSSYLFYPAQVNFNSALNLCKQHNATMLFIDNKVEDDFIKQNYLKNVTSGIWLAIYDFVGNETNVNYYTNETLKYSNWYPLDTHSVSELCTRYDKTFSSWADIFPSSTYSVICETTANSQIYIRNEEISFSNVNQVNAKSNIKCASICLRKNCKKFNFDKEICEVYF
jgi:hypothetical protein